MIMIMMNQSQQQLQQQKIINDMGSKIVRHNSPALLGHELQYLNMVLYHQKVSGLGGVLSYRKNHDNYNLSETDKRKIEWPYG